MPKPRKYVVVGCSRGCSLNEFALPQGAATALHSWFEEGVSDEVIAVRMQQGFAYHVSFGAVGRHRKRHLLPQEHALKLNTAAAPGGGLNGGAAGERPRRVSDVELLEQLIAAGASVLEQGGVRVSSEQMLKAIELKHKITAGAAFEDFYEAIGLSMTGLAEERVSEEEREEIEADEEAAVDE